MNYIHFSLNSFLRDLIYLEKTRKHLTRSLELAHLAKPGSMFAAHMDKSIKSDVKHLANYGRMTLDELQ